MNLLTLFSGPYAILARLVIIGVVLIAFFGVGWVKGNQHGTQKLTDYQGAQAAAAIKIVTRQGEATERVVTKYVAVAGKTKVITDTIEKEVVKYVDSKPLALACMLDDRWVQLHDAAAAGTVPPPAGATDGGPGSVTAAEAIPTITGNYRAAGRNKDKLEALQEWIREQIKITNDKE